MQRINAQMPLTEKCKGATHIIDNSGDRDHTTSQVIELHQNLRQSWKQWKFRAWLLMGLLGMLMTFRMTWRFFIPVQWFNLKNIFTETFLISLNSFKLWYMLTIYDLMTCHSDISKNGKCNFFVKMKDIFRGAICCKLQLPAFVTTPAASAKIVT